MAYIKLPPLALFLLATSLMFLKNIEAEGAFCASTFCTLSPDCGIGCRCYYGGCYNNRELDSAAKTMEENSDLCESHEECKKKGSGDFCARSPNPLIHHGWCFHSHSEALKQFFAITTQYLYAK
ncbi:unnamed protein product [Sphenostylis stenocarpa]|uniref:Albumin I chain a domain-containing protein n=1 Tax=Sphenostylis stenocarpa TaxID=92480 RepID=A0AA86W4K2_9FABA|nr:unnamed protein product [Sphenostylis stenocarpa]